MEREYEYELTYTEFGDMKMYNPNFSEDLIKNMTDNEIRIMFKDYYSNRNSY